MYLEVCIPFKNFMSTIQMIAVKLPTLASLGCNCKLPKHATTNFKYCNVIFFKQTVLPEGLFFGKK